MYSRHRSSGNGYRPNSMGMASASAPRASPESAMRGPGFYNPEYRNFNRGPPPPRPYPSPRKSDLFMEAGRLAAEYLVMKGLLPPNVLPPKWPNAGFKKHPGEFQEFRPLQEGENMQLPPEGRLSTFARRQANPIPDAGSSRRRYGDEYNHTESRSSMRKRTESFRNHSSDLDHEHSRSGSWSDKPRVSAGKETNDDSMSEHNGEQQSGQDNTPGVKNLNTSEISQKDEDVGSSESYSCKLQSLDDIGSKSSASGTEEIPLETDKEITKEPDDMKNLNVDIEEVKVCSDNDDTKKPNDAQDVSVQSGEAGSSISNHGTNLLSLCQYAKVPTRARSSLTNRSSKANLSTSTEAANTSIFESAIGMEISIEDDGRLDDDISYQPHALGCLDSGEVAPFVPTGKGMVESGSPYANEHGKCTRSQSFPDQALIYGDESSQLMATFKRFNSMDSRVNERGEKRTVEHTDREEASKKPREWFPSMVTEADDYSNLTSFNRKSLPEEKSTPGKDVVMAVDDDNLMHLFPKGVGEPSIVYPEEKQLLPSSFKICDLNLIEASDMNENRDHDSILFYPSISEAKKEAASVDIDSSVNSNCNVITKQNMHSNDTKEVEVIDLDNDSAEEDEDFNISKRKKDLVYPDLKNFPSHIESTTDIPDAQDGYGLMISELLGNDISNCSSIPTDINSLHNEVGGLHNQEEILSDDDPIYMSLGEIPISMPDI